MNEFYECNAHAGIMVQYHIDSCLYIAEASVNGVAGLANPFSIIADY